MNAAENRSDQEDMDTTEDSNIVSNGTASPKESEDVMEEDNACSKGTICFVVNQFSKLKGIILSDPIYLWNLPWKIMCMAWPLESQTPKERKSLGFFLQCNPEAEGPSWSCQAEATLTLVHRLDPSRSHSAKISHLFFSRKNDCGWKNFAFWSEVVDPRYGFIGKNKITLQVDICAEAPHGVANETQTIPVVPPPQVGLLPRYNMGSRPRGICLIINNKNFWIKEKQRNGAEKDEKILKEVFTKLDFKVDLQSDLTRNEMEAKMKHYGQQTDHSRYNAFICIIMSHGKENDCIAGVDDQMVQIEDIMAEFDAQHCPSLKDKPKLFFIQSCRGGCQDKHSDGFGLCADSTLARSVCPKGADFLLAFATTPGYVAWRTPEGSFYIKVLADVISKFHKDVHLIDMLTLVNKRVSEEVYKLSGGKRTQIPAPSFTLRKLVYL